MMQGDAYNVTIDIVNDDDSVVTPDDVEEVEICLGDLIKYLSTGEVTFNEAAGKWVFPLSQEESFRLYPSRTKVQVRVKWKSGSVEGCNLGYKNIQESISKEIL